MMEADELEAYVTTVIFLVNGNDIGVHDAKLGYKELAPLLRASRMGLCHDRQLKDGHRFFLPNRAKIEKYMLKVAIQEAK